MLTRQQFLKGALGLAIGGALAGCGAEGKKTDPLKGLRKKRRGKKPPPTPRRKRLYPDRDCNPRINLPNVWTGQKTKYWYNCTCGTGGPSIAALTHRKSYPCHHDVYLVMRDSVPIR